MQIGRKLYYDKATGNVIVDTGERSGSIVETTVQQDFSVYAALADRVPTTVGCLQLEYGEFAQDFAECSGYRVDLNGDTTLLLFSYPDPSDPESPPVYHPPLSVKLAQIESELQQYKLDQAQANAELFEMMLMLTGGGVKCSPKTAKSSTTMCCSFVTG